MQIICFIVFCKCCDHFARFVECFTFQQCSITRNSLKLSETTETEIVTKVLLHGISWIQNFLLLVLPSTALAPSVCYLSRLCVSPLGEDQIFVSVISECVP